MTPGELAQYIAALPVSQCHTEELEAALEARRRSKSAPWYSSQKEHWLGWLGEYDGPGAYDRLMWEGRTAEFVYNHIQCAPMLSWLAEAAGLQSEEIEAANKAALAAPRRAASQCGAFRRIIPWESVSGALLTRTSAVVQTA